MSKGKQTLFEKVVEKADHMIHPEHESEAKEESKESEPVEAPVSKDSKVKPASGSGMASHPKFAKFKTEVK